jgi:hypothetical protein
MRVKTETRRITIEKAPTGEQGLFTVRNLGTSSPLIRDLPSPHAGARQNE